jgi:ketosteroid isomerase-like protein
MRPELSMTAGVGVEAVAMAMLERFSEAVATRDLAGVLALFATDQPAATFIDAVSGVAAVGEDDLRAAVGQLLRRPRTYRWSWRSCLVTAGGPMMAVSANAVIAVEGRGQPLQRSAHVTGVLLQRYDRWLWLHYHASRQMADPRLDGNHHTPSRTPC